MAPYYDNDSKNTGNPIVEWILDFLDDHKKQIIKLFVTAFLIFAVCFGIYLHDNLWTKNDQFGYECAVQLRDMMDNPETFRLHTQIFLVQQKDSEGNVECVYTVFRYSVKDATGKMTSDQAIFKDGRYIIDYTVAADPNSPNYEEQIQVKKAMNSYDMLGDGDKFRTINLKLDQIKEKMGLE